MRKLESILVLALYDGYYYTGVFDTSQKEYDDIIDTYPYVVNGTSAYPLNIKYISY